MQVQDLIPLTPNAEVPASNSDPPSLWDQAKKSRPMNQQIYTEPEYVTEAGREFALLDWGGLDTKHVPDFTPAPDADQWYEDIEVAELEQEKHQAKPQPKPAHKPVHKPQH